MSDCVEDEAEMTPEPLAELRSLPKDSEEPRPDVDDMELEPEPDDMELCRTFAWLCPSPPFFRPSGGGCSLNLKGEMWAGSSPRCSGWCMGWECGCGWAECGWCEWWWW